MREDLFQKLRQKRLEAYEVFKDPDYSGVFDFIKDLYKKKAHFIYELLQNADDAKAKSVKFILHTDKLVFVHNGNVPFTITDPLDDSTTKGHINSITSIGASTKSGKISDEDLKIGKFGIGFKSVFSFTASPEIYDDEFRFMISDYIVPELIKQDYPKRKKGETVFVFPFNNENKQAGIAFDEITRELTSLNHPILFLNSLTKIEWDIPGDSGYYTYTESSIKSFNIDHYSPIEYCPFKEQSLRSNQVCSDGIKVSRLIQDDRGVKHKYSLVFFINNGMFDYGSTHNAFCYFKTEVNTGLRFIVHAPFLITYNRETIKDDPWNTILLDRLSDLMADSIDIFLSEKLINESLYRVLPIDNLVSNKKVIATGNSSLDFGIFYNKLITKLKSSQSRYFPSISGELLRLEQVCIARGNDLIELLSKNDLEAALSLPGADWTFGSLNENDNLFVFMQSGLGTRVFTSKALPDILSDSFLAEQSIDWLHKLYGFLKEVPSIAGRFKIKPIIRIEGASINSTPYDSGLQRVYVPSEDKRANVIFRSLGAKFVTKELLGRPDSHYVICHFLELLEADKDIEKLIQEQTNQFWESQSIEWLTEFYIFVMKNRISLIELVKEKPIIRVTSKSYNSAPFDKEGNPLVYLQGVTSLNIECYSNVNFYYVDPSLTENKSALEFLRRYLQIPEVKDHEVFRNILTRLFTNEGNQAYREIVRNTKEAKQMYCNFINQLSRYVGLRNTEDMKPLFDSLKCYAFLVIKNNDEREMAKGSRIYYPSSIMVDYLGQGVKWIDMEFYSSFIEDEECFNTLLVLAGVHFRPEVKYPELEICGLTGYLSKVNSIEQSLNLIHLLIDLLDHGTITTLHNSKTASLLNSYAWLFDSSSNKRRAIEILKLELNHIYFNIQSPHLDHILAVIVFQQETTNSDTSSLLNNVLHMAATNGHNEDEVANLLEDILGMNHEEYQQLRGSMQLMKSHQPQQDVDDSGEDGQELFDATAAAAVMDDIRFGTTYEGIRASALSQEKYSYKWFLDLLNLEIISSGENSRKRDVTLYFDKIEPYPRSKKMVVITNNSNYIPSIVENLADFKLNLTLKDGSKKELRVDAASRRIDDEDRHIVHKLLLKFIPEDVEKYHNIKLEEVSLISLNVKDPVFLLHELLIGFEELPALSDYAVKSDFNFQAGLSKLIRNVSFIYGPPGTGKTTYLAERVVCDLLDKKYRYKEEITGDSGFLTSFAYRNLMSKSPNLNILVLAPTNKAADVVAEKIISVCQSNGSDNYKNYLVRFETTDSELIEKEATDLIYERNQNREYNKLHGTVVVTTIHRYAYDGFKSLNNENMFRNKKWDIVIFDEASMIPLAYIVFTMFNMRFVNEHCLMIIAGDPYQIPPVQLVDLWSNENIYSLCGLRSFNPVKQEEQMLGTIGIFYPILNLTTQYRSVSSIGELFSRFSYDAMLTHHRGENRVKLPDLGFKLDDFTVIQYPVNSNNLLYKSSRLKKSPYHPYSVLFTVELIDYMLQKLNQIDHRLTIGIISPYRVQADLAGKIISTKFPVHDKIKVSVATVHGFQGDECDIVICLFNAPAGLYQTNAHRVFINNQNILNVAISRARDHLIMLVPDINTRGYINLTGINSILSIMEGVHKPTIYSSKDMELILKKNQNYVSEHTFITTHQLVNVYSAIPENDYEFRISDEAVDVQIFDA